MTCLQFVISLLMAYSIATNVTVSSLQVRLTAAETLTATDAQPMSPLVLRVLQLQAGGAS